MTFRIYQVQQGVPITAVSSLQLLSAGEAGTATAHRRLVHPDGDLFPPITYYTNPTRTFNFANDVLRHPIVDVTRTLTSSRTIRFEEVVEDVIVTEQWEPIGGLSMPFFMYAFLYEYLVNPPELDIANQQYIIWEPRDETVATFRVEVIGLQLGSGNPGRHSIRRLRAKGGPSDGGTIATPTDTMDTSPTSILDVLVTLTMRIIEQVE